MTLVEEIEQAAKRYNETNIHTNDEWVADILTDNDSALSASWWPRIKAAILAGQEMADYFPAQCDDLNPAVRRFREAMGK